MLVYVLFRLAELAAEILGKADQLLERAWLSNPVSV